MTKQFSVQSAPSKPPKLNPDFRHRLSILGDEATASHLTDAVERLAEQAESLIVIIQDQFIEADGCDGRGRLSDQIIYNSLEAVAALVVDMKSICRAYYEATQEIIRTGSSTVRG